MSIAIDFEFLGLPKLKRAFDLLPDVVGKKIVQSAIRKAAKPVKAKAESLIPRGPDKPQGQHLADVGLKIKSMRRSRSGFGVLIVTPSREELGIDPKEKGFYPVHLELGHGNVPAHPYMRDAMDSMRDQTRLKIGAEIIKGIEREAKKLARR